ncbi:MAG: OmpH family outer membrane protein, partial [Verrucomicrobiota bacterium]
QLVNNLNVQLSRAQSTAQQQLNRDEVALVQNFRNEVRPVAVKIALERGFTIVLTKNEAVLFAYDDNFDITEEVIRRMAAPGSGLTPLVP